MPTAGGAGDRSPGSARSHRRATHQADHLRSRRGSARRWFRARLCADLIGAGEDATFGLAEVKRGLLAAAGGIGRTATHLPRAVVMELALLGDALTAKRLSELGLVNAVVPAGSALPVALDLARRIVANAPMSVAVGKQVIDAAPA